ncbi:hypothetical protein ACI7YT_12665 [Microbacterium sp. M]|uniref:hypothetical protein n=1 Tax=Microbacterium sp. M TaxID=3377125 RepID=UPI0038684776
MNEINSTGEALGTEDRLAAALDVAREKLIAAGMSVEQAAEAAETLAKFAEKDYDRALRSGPITYTNRAARRASARAERSRT